MIRRMIAGQLLPWRRFWTPPAGRLSAGHDGRGFLDDPEDELGRAMNPELHLLSELLARSCLVLSGQPGIGKTTEVDALAARSMEWLAPDETLWHRAQPRSASHASQQAGYQGRGRVEARGRATFDAHHRSQRRLASGNRQSLGRSVGYTRMYSAAALEECEIKKIGFNLIKSIEWHSTYRLPAQRGAAAVSPEQSAQQLSLLLPGTAPTERGRAPARRHHPARSARSLPGNPGG